MISIASIKFLRVREGKPQQFQLDVSLIQSAVVEFSDSLKKFTIFINDREIKVNFSLLASFTTVGQFSFNFVDPIHLTVTDQDFKCFDDFFLTLDGSRFTFSDYSISSLIKLNGVFHLQCWDKFIASQTFEIVSPNEAIQFLLTPSAELLGSFFKKSILILLANFTHLSTAELASLPFLALEEIFSSPLMKFHDENEFLSKLLELIKANPLQKGLLKLVRFEFVSSDMILECQQFLQLEELDEETYAALFPRLASDVVIPHSASIGRWEGDVVFSKAKRVRKTEI